ncbi:HEAT repeat domain-containing protein [Chloroflexota bacterium]
MRRDSKWDVEKMKAEGDVVGLIEALKVNNYPVRRNAAEALGNIGGDRAIVSLIENMFTNPGDIGSADSLRNLLPETNLTEEMFSIAIKAAMYPPSEISENYWDQSGFLEDLNEAVEELCNRPSPISTNLLILISQKKDASMALKICKGYQERKVSFDFSKQRKRATFELTRRHFKTYESAAFLKSSRERYGYR